MTKALRKPAPAPSLRIATVPDASVAAKYIGRSFNGVRDFDIFRYARKNRVNMLIQGPTGPGKTMATRAFSATEGLAFYAVSSNVGADPSQLFGKFVPNEAAKTEADPKFIWVDGPVTDLVRHGGVLLINEVNFLPPRVATVLFQLLDGNRQITLLDHKGEIIRAHLGPGECWCGEADCTDKMLLVVADMNPDYVGTSTLNAAFSNRFGFHLVWDYSPDVEVKLIKSTALRNLAAGLRREHDDGDLETPCSTNMLIEFERVAVDMGNIEFAIEMFVNHFTRDERAGVKQSFDLIADNLRDDFTAPEPVVPEGEVQPEDDDWDFEGLPHSGGFDFTN